MIKIGFIGLGNMGKGMSVNLSKNNYIINGFDLNSEVFNELKKYNINQMKNIKELVENSDYIITMLPDGKAVLKVWEEILMHAKSSQILVDCSTIDVKTSLLVQKNAQKLNIETLDAPVSGGVVGADEGTLTFMIGGNEKTLNNVKDLFDIMGKKSIHCGAYGAGQSAKICNNMLLASTMIAVGESFELGKNLGLDLNKLFEVLSTSSGSCWAINTYCPIKGIGPKSPSDNNYNGGFSTALMHKDLGLAVDAINQTNSKNNYGLSTFNRFDDLVKAGKGHLDFSNIINE